MRHYRFALSLLLGCCAFASVVHAVPRVCFDTAMELHRDHFYRMDICENEGPNSPACIAADERENDGWTAIRRNCPTTQDSCLPAMADQFRYWPRRINTCRAAGSASDAACVAAVEHDNDLYFMAMGSCGYFELTR